MKQVWKFQLELTDIAIVDMPKGARCIHVGEQYGNLCLWAIVDPGEPTEPRAFRIAGTGHQIANAHCEQYLGTVHLASGAVILHVFSATEPATPAAREWDEEDQFGECGRGASS